MFTMSVVQTFYIQVSLNNPTFLHFFCEFDVLLCMYTDISYYIYYMYANIQQKT